MSIFCSVPVVPLIETVGWEVDTEASGLDLVGKTLNLISTTCPTGISSNCLEAAGSFFPSISTDIKAPRTLSPKFKIFAQQSNGCPSKTNLDSDPRLIIAKLEWLEGGDKSIRSGPAQSCNRQMMFPNVRSAINSAILPSSQSIFLKSEKKWRIFLHFSSGNSSRSAFLAISNDSPGSNRTALSLNPFRIICKSSMESFVICSSNRILSGSDSLRSLSLAGIFPALEDLANTIILFFAIAKQFPISPPPACLSPMLALSSSKTSCNTISSGSSGGLSLISHLAKSKPTSNKTVIRNSNKSSCSMISFRRILFWAAKRNSMAAQRTRLNCIRLIK